MPLCLAAVKASGSLFSEKDKTGTEQVGMTQQIQHSASHCAVFATFMRHQQMWQQQQQWNEQAA